MRGCHMRYRAFFSYARADDRVANWLHRQLDSYRTPKSLVGAEGELGPAPARLHPIFRDRTDLEAGGHVDGALMAALAASETLVVLCTPTSARSPWVNRECAAFIELGREKLIFPVIAAGEPDSGNAETECFPPALRGRGLLAADLREIRKPNGQLVGDGREGARMKLIAGLIGLPLDRVIQRERRRQRQLVTLLSGAALTFLAVAVAAAGFGWLSEQRAATIRVQAGQITIERDEANRQRDEARRRRDLADTARRNEAAQRKRADASAQLAEDRRRVADEARAQALAALAQVLMSRTREEDTQSNVHLQLAVAASYLDPDNRTGAVSYLRDRVRRAHSLRVTLPHDQPVRIAAFARNGATVAVGDEAGGVAVYDAYSGRPTTTRVDLRGEIMALEPLGGSTGRAFVAASLEGDLAVLSSGSLPPMVRETGHTENMVLIAAASPSGEMVITAGMDAARIWDVRTLNPVTPFLTSDDAEGRIALADFIDAETAITAGPDNAIRTWSAATGTPVTALAVHGSKIVAGGLDPWGGAVTADRDNVVRHTNLRDGQSRILATLDASVRSISVGNAGAIVVIEGGRARFIPFAENQEGHPIVFGPNLRTANFLSHSREGLIAASYVSDGEGDIAIQSPGDIRDAGDERRLGVWLYINDVGMGRGVYNQRVAYTSVGDALAVIDNPNTVRIFDVGDNFGGVSGSRRAAAVNDLSVGELRTRACALLPSSARNAPLETLHNDPAIQAVAAALPRRLCG
jgi:WD40 repeat protein